MAERIRRIVVTLVIAACILTGLLLYYVSVTEYHRDTPPQILEEKGNYEKTINSH